MLDFEELPRIRYIMNLYSLQNLNSIEYWNHDLIRVMESKITEIEIPQVGNYIFTVDFQ